MVRAGGWDARAIMGQGSGPARKGSQEGGWQHTYLLALKGRDEHVRRVHGEADARVGKALEVAAVAQLAVQDGLCDGQNTWGRVMERR